jgi:hypothetical protein
MSDNKDEYPVTGIHTFLEEASKEFKRFRFQAKVNLIGSIILLLFLSRFLIFVFGNYGPPLFHYEHIIRYFDFFFLLASTAAVLWSLDVWLRQRKFVSRWGERFERLEALEEKYLSDKGV